jgi:Mor family transcriptional regulator
VPKPTKKCEAQTLPGRLQAIADAAGIDAAIAIAREFGGRRLYLPALKTLRRRRQHPLVVLLGLECALKVVETIGGFGEYFDVPTARNELIYLKLRDGLSQGLSTSELAKQTGICRRAVLYRLAAMRVANKDAARASRGARTGRKRTHHDDV